MAEVRNKRGPKKRYGPRRAYHFLLEVAKVEAFEQRAQAEGGIIEYVVKLIDRDLGLDRPEKPV